MHVASAFPLAHHDRAGLTWSFWLLKNEMPVGGVRVCRIWLEVVFFLQKVVLQCLTREGLPQIRESFSGLTSAKDLPGTELGQTQVGCRIIPIYKEGIT